MVGMVDDVMIKLAYGDDFAKVVTHYNDSILISMFYHFKHNFLSSKCNQQFQNATYKWMSFHF